MSDTTPPSDETTTNTTTPRLTPTGREAKLCPGLNGNFCGNPRNAQGYCKECRKRYQRDRYALLKTKAGQNYIPRPHARVEGESCDCCGMVKVAGYLRVNSEESRYGFRRVCETCWEAIQKLREEFGASTFMRICTFAMDNQSVFLGKPANPSPASPPSSQTVVDLRHNKANSIGHASPSPTNAIGGKRVTPDEAFEYEYVVRVRNAAKKYGFTDDNGYTDAEETFGDEIRRVMTEAAKAGTLELKSILTEEEAPWLF